MSIQSRAIVSHVYNYEKCVKCGELTPIDYGYFLSWTLAEWDKQDETDKRFFCNLECMNQWLNDIARTGIEK